MPFVTNGPSSIYYELHGAGQCKVLFVMVRLSSYLAIAIDVFRDFNALLSSGPFKSNILLNSTTNLFKFAPSLPFFNFIIFLINIISLNCCYHFNISNLSVCFVQLCVFDNRGCGRSSDFPNCWNNTGFLIYCCNADNYAKYKLVN